MLDTAEVSPTSFNEVLYSFFLAFNCSIAELFAFAITVASVSILSILLFAVLNALFTALTLVAVLIEFLPLVIAVLYAEIFYKCSYSFKPSLRFTIPRSIVYTTAVIGMKINIPAKPIRLPPTLTATSTQIDGSPTELPTT